MPNVKQINVSGATYDISAKYIIEYPAVGDPIEHDWKSITDLIDAGIQLVPLDELPTADADAYASYSGKIVLTPISGETDRAENIITRSESEPYTYKWEQIGTTAAQLDTKADKGTYTSETPSVNVTSANGAGTFTTSSNGEQTANGAATVTYDKATGIQSAGEVTIQGSNFNFNGASVTLEQDIDYTPEGSVTVKAVGTHSHTVNVGNASTVNVVTSVSVGDTTVVATEGIAAVELTGTTTFNTDAIKSASLIKNDTYTDTFMKNATVNSGVLSFVNGTASITTTSASTGTVGLTTTAAGTTSVVTSVTVGGQTPVINAMPAITLSQEAEKTITGTFTGTSATISVSIDYTPSGTIGGSQTVAAHSHTITYTSTTITGTAAVAVSNHTHTVDVPNHTHDLGNHTHNVNLN